MCGDPMRGAYAVPLALAVRFWTDYGLRGARRGHGLQCRLVCAMMPAMTADDVERLRLVTRRFEELQGLRQLVLLPACLCAFWMQPT